MAGLGCKPGKPPEYRNDMPIQVELHRLFESVGRNVSPANRASTFGTELFADITGFHIYGELNLTMKLTAAKDTSDAGKLLRVIQEYTLIAEACASVASVQLLEVQGERIHLLMPLPKVDANSVEELLRFSTAFTKEVYSRISKTAGKEFRGFKMAADHGRAILVSTGGQPNGSIVSLGPAANAPAKELKRNGVAAHLRMRVKHYAARVPTTSHEEWINVPVLEPTGVIANFASAELTGRYADRSNQFIVEGMRTPMTVRFADAGFLTNFAGGYVGQAIKVQGFPLRADLDGFSKEVETAFANGGSAVIALVQRFFSIMHYPDQFRVRMGKTIDLPWAGDCATVIVLPNGNGYAEAREFLPAKAASEWHTQVGESDSHKNKWSGYFGKATWSVGVAGGDEDEGASGFVVVAPIAGRNRDFMVAAGWGIGRSLDAQESEGVKGNDTVIPGVDYLALDSGHKANFEELNTVFWIAHNLTAAKLRSSGIEQLGKASSIFVPKISEPIPQSKPWYGQP